MIVLLDVAVAIVVIGLALVCTLVPLGMLVERMIERDPISYFVAGLLSALVVHLIFTG